MSMSDSGPFKENIRWNVAGRETWRTSLDAQLWLAEKGWRGNDAIPDSHSFYQCALGMRCWDLEHVSIKTFSLAMWKGPKEVCGFEEFNSAVGKLVRNHLKIPLWPDSQGGNINMWPQAAEPIWNRTYRSVLMVRSITCRTSECSLGAL